MNRRILLIFIFAILYFSCSSLDAQKNICIRNENGKTLEIKIEGESFYHIYINSVTISEVTEKLVINNDNTIILSETEYSSYGSGMASYSSSENIISFRDGKCINNTNIVFENYLIRLPVIDIPKHKLVVGGNEFYLLDYFMPGELIAISMK